MLIETHLRALGADNRQPLASRSREIRRVIEDMGNRAGDQHGQTPRWADGQSPQIIQTGGGAVS